MNWTLFFSTFITIFLAEFGDKTQFAAMAAGTQAQSTKEVLLAVILGLSLAGAIGVFAGKFLSQYIPPEALRYVSGSLFILVGCWVLLKK
jgi:putative Ca2+/H+ antiporter (TMEM165/GDT1 family)